MIDTQKFVHGGTSGTRIPTVTKISDFGHLSRACLIETTAILDGNLNIIIGRVPRRVTITDHGRSQATSNSQLPIITIVITLKDLTDMANLGTPQNKIVFGDADELGTRTTRVSKILVHPIKSCRGISVLEAKYTPEGLENDRKWSIISAETNRIITAREDPKMILIVPRIELDPLSPYGGKLEVSFPENSGCETFSVPLNPDEKLLKTWEILDNIDLFTYRNIDGYICQVFPSPLTSQTASSILSKYFGRPVHLVFKGPRARTCQPTLDFPDLSATLHYQDGYPLLILSEESVKAAEGEVRGYVGVQGVGENWKDDKLVVERFRPNIVLKGGSPFKEDIWEEISLDSYNEADLRESMEIKLVSKCVRCLLPNVNPETGIRDKAVPYKVLMKFRSNVDARLKWKPCFGVNGVPSGSGVVKVGDWVCVKKLLSA